MVWLVTGGGNSLVTLSFKDLKKVNHSDLDITPYWRSMGDPSTPLRRE